MAKVHFVEIEPFVSCCKDLEVSYHIPPFITTSSKHYIALCELSECSQFTWVWASKTVPLELKNGLTINWRKGKVTFADQMLPKLSDGREYFLMYCNEDGTILGQSGPFQFFTSSDQFSSIDLQNTLSYEVVPPKEENILMKRIQDEMKKSSRLEELLNHKETQILQLEKNVARLSAELTKSTEAYNQLVIDKLEAEQQLETSHTENKRLIDEVQYLQTGASLAGQDRGMWECFLVTCKCSL